VRGIELAGWGGADCSSFWGFLRKGGGNIFCQEEEARPRRGKPRSWKVAW